MPHEIELATAAAPSPLWPFEQFPHLAFTATSPEALVQALPSITAPILGTAAVCSLAVTDAYLTAHPAFLDQCWGIDRFSQAPIRSIAAITSLLGELLSEHQTRLAGITSADSPLVLVGVGFMEAIAIAEHRSAEVADYAVALMERGHETGIHLVLADLVTPWSGRTTGSVHATQHELTLEFGQRRTHAPYIAGRVELYESLLEDEAIGY